MSLKIDSMNLTPLFQLAASASSARDTDNNNMKHYALAAIHPNQVVDMEATKEKKTRGFVGAETGRYICPGRYNWSSEEYVSLLIPYMRC